MSPIPSRTQFTFTQQIKLVSNIGATPYATPAYWPLFDLLKAF